MLRADPITLTSALRAFDLSRAMRGRGDGVRYAISRVMAQTANGLRSTTLGSVAK